MGVRAPENAWQVPAAGERAGLTYGACQDGRGKRSADQSHSIIRRVWDRHRKSPGQRRSEALSRGGVKKMKKRRERSIQNQGHSKTR